MDSVDAIQGGMNGQREPAFPAEYRGLDRLQLAPVEVGPGEIAATKTLDRSKRDEWSEGGVMSLLEVYESKWLLRNRAKLKGSDWEDIAHEVSDRNCGKKALKTPNQCKNKIESMKKRYRAETVGASNASNPASGSSWKFYARMDSLLKGAYSSQVKDVTADCANGIDEPGLQALPKVEMENSEHVLKRVSDKAHPQTTEKAQIGKAVDLEAERHMQDSNQDDGSNTLPDNRKESRGMDSDISTPRSKSPIAGDGSGKLQPSKRRKSSNKAVAESIRLLAHSILKIEQTRMEIYKDTERLRAEAEIKRGEMELKRTEIIANTQLEIAKLLSKRVRGRNNRSGNSSLRTEPTMPETVSMNAEGRNGQLWPLLFLFGS